jgi:hypothetical protein
MPPSGWNGKFMGVGNGGWSGEIWYPFMGAALQPGTWLSRRACSFRSGGQIHGG